MWLLCLQEGKLYVSGSSSEVTEPDCVDSEKYPLYQHAQHVDFTLRPGQALYIPALWLHSVLSRTSQSQPMCSGGTCLWRHTPGRTYMGTGIL